MEKTNGPLIGFIDLLDHLRNKFGSADPRQLREAVDAGKIPCVRTGGILAFDLKAVEAALARSGGLPRRLTHIAATARILGVSVEWLTAKAKANEIPHLDVDDRILMDPESVREHLLGVARTQPKNRGDNLRGGK